MNILLIKELVNKDGSRISGDEKIDQDDNMTTSKITTDDAVRMQRQGISWYTNFGRVYYNEDDDTNDGVELPPEDKPVKTKKEAEMTDLEKEKAREKRKKHQQAMIDANNTPSHKRSYSKADKLKSESKNKMNSLIEDIFTKKDFSSKSINFLCVTSNARHKNLKNLVTSFINAKLDSKKKFSLFITTSGNNFIKENKKIIYLNYINREEMLRYYSKSHFIVLPSLIESFGLPIVEGIKSGSNVLISNIDSLKEICTPSISFNPLNIKDLISALEKAASLSYEKNSLLTIKNEINNFIDIINRDV